jgi:hypothetical protein
MKILFGTLALSMAFLAFAGTNEKSSSINCDPSNVSTYQDTIPRKDTSKKKDKNRKDKREKRDTMYQHHI